ncbi:MAG TPA: hypothetical protein VMR02_17705 [Terracidiphilus sp.]|jgi:hypothetical protein|nr:hypothetical protein [Terracidiphilus sp.]
MTADELQTQLAARLRIPALINPAIVCCRDAMTELGLLTDEGEPVNLKDGSRLANDPRELEALRVGSVLAVKKGHRAYREALPPLCGTGNIRDFIACVAHGIALDVFDVREASKLLYAAQVAGSAEAEHSKSQPL